MAVPALGLSEPTVWPIRGPTRPPVDHTVGLLGAAVALLLTGGLEVALVRAQSAPDALGLLYFLLYPVSALVGYDLAGGAGVTDGMVLRAAGYAGGYAVAIAALAAGFAVCNALGAQRESPSWGVAMAVCAVGAPVGRIAVRALHRHLGVRPAALLAGSFVLTLVAWFCVLAAMMAYMVRVDA